jgi:hypothetical protein
MNWYFWFAISALILCLLSCIYHLARLINKGKPTDYSKQMGDVKSAIAYAYTGAMSPAKKESAYLHLPTYTAGLLYHIGTFTSIFFFFLFLFGVMPVGMISWIIAGFLAVTGLSGFGILIKRMMKQELRALSNPDDYISNLLVTILQFITAYVLYSGSILPLYFVTAGIVLLYLPLGKLKHTIYFFAARYHLGFFFGWRGVWPPK